MRRPAVLALAAALAPGCAGMNHRCTCPVEDHRPASKPAASEAGRFEADSIPRMPAPVAAEASRPLAPRPAPAVAASPEPVEVVKLAAPGPPSPVVLAPEPAAPPMLMPEPVAAPAPPASPPPIVAPEEAIPPHQPADAAVVPEAAPPQPEAPGPSETVAVAPSRPVAPEAPPAPEGRPVARVGDEVITLPELTRAVKARIARLPPGASPSRREIIALAKSVLKGMVVRSLVLQEARAVLGGPERVAEAVARIEGRWAREDAARPGSLRDEFVVRTLASEMMGREATARELDAYLDALRKRWPITSIMSQAELAAEGRRAAAEDAAVR